MGYQQPGMGLWLRRLLLTLALLPSVLQPATASQVRALNIEQMTHRADRIFSGRVVAVQVRFDRTLRQHVTDVTLEVERAVKGDLTGRVTITLFGWQKLERGESRAGRAMKGLPLFSENEEVVLFLYAESRLGFTSPVGLGQGKFSVFKDKKGERLAVNAFGNRNLLKGLSEPSTGGLSPSASLLRQEGVKLDRLLDAAEKIHREIQDRTAIQNEGVERKP